MLIDSHCHLNLLDLTEFDGDLSNVIDLARQAGVGHLLSVCVELNDFPILCAIADQYPQVISISLGIHPNNEACQVSANQLEQLVLSHPACIALGETGLDYYREESEAQRFLQKENFRAHIQAAKVTHKPLIIHTRQAAEDTLRLLAEEKAHEIGGVMHCFTENWAIAQRALDMNFYISLSGIVSFKNASIVQEVAKKVPLDRLLIETDSPYLAPVPFRGKQNQPAYVKHVAEALSALRGVPYETIVQATHHNFYRCFHR